MSPTPVPGGGIPGPSRWARPWPRLCYIPPKRMFAEGNYEAVVAKIQPGQGEYLVKEAVALLRELKRK